MAKEVSPTVVPAPGEDLIDLDDREIIDISRSLDHLRKVGSYVSRDRPRDEAVSTAIEAVENDFKADLSLSRAAYSRYLVRRRISLVELVSQCEEEIQKRDLKTLDVDTLLKLRSESIRELDSTSKTLDEAAKLPMVHSEIEGEARELTDEEKRERASLDVLREIFDAVEYNILEKGKARLKNGSGHSD